MELREIVENRLEEHVDEVYRGGHAPLFVGVHGSWNYDLVDEQSDVDTVAVVFPTFDDFVFGKSPVSTTKKMGNGEQISLKDVRVFFAEFWKQNPSCLQLLFTKYKYVDTFFEQLWSDLCAKREAIARFDEVAAVRSILGCAQTCYRTMMRRPHDDFGKNLSNIFRFTNFAEAYTSGLSYEECLTSFSVFSKDFIMTTKRNKDGLDYDTALELAGNALGRLCSRIDDFERQRHKTDLIVKKQVEDIQRDIMRAGCWHEGW